MIDASSVEATPQRRRLSSRQIKLLVGGLVVAAVVIYLIIAAAGGATSYYVTVSEAVEGGVSKRNVRVAGFVVGESIVWEPRDLHLAFEMLDDSGTLPVVYSGARPDMFRDGAEVVVEGKLNADGVFEARSMLLKCPSKYEEAQ